METSEEPLEWSANPLASGQRPSSGLPASMVLENVRLQHNTKLPLAIFKAKDGTVQYLTHSKVKEIIRKAVKTVYPDISKKDLAMYSCHSIRVWACVCLDEVGMPQDFIKKGLC